MNAPDYIFPFNETKLLFLPCLDLNVSDAYSRNSNDRSYIGDKLNSHTGMIAQVTVRLRDDLKLSTVNSSKLLVAERITSVIEMLVLSHIHSAPALPETVIVHSNGYTLEGTRKPWTYGRNAKLTWGGQNLVPADDKWTFTIEPVGRRAT